MKLFASLLLLLTISGTMTGQTSESGVEGVISMSPTHGGPIRKDEPESRPLPNVAFVIKKGDEVVGSFTTDEHGAFRVPLPPGAYKITRRDTPGGIGKFENYDVQVAAGEMKKVTWTVDTGLR